MKSKKLLVLASLSLVFSLGACGNGSKDPLTTSSVESITPSSSVEPTTTPTSEVEYLPKLDKKVVKLNNQSEDYTLKHEEINSYYYPGGNVPLVGIVDMINTLDGFFLSDMIHSSFDQENETANFYWEDSGYKFTLDVDCKNDTLTASDMVFFNFTDMPEGIDYASHFEEVDGVSYEGEPVVFDLKPYNFDMFLRGDDVIMPFNIFNSLFMNANIANILWNGTDFYFYSTYFGEESEILPSRDETLQGKNIPDDVLEARNNGLYFILDYFYGLKEVKGIDNFKDYIASKESIYNKLTSNAGRDSDKGFKELFVKDLDDPHTGYSFKSMYAKLGLDNTISVPLYYDDLGPRYKSIIDVMGDLETEYEKKFPFYRLVRYEGNTAFVKFDEFKVAYDDEIFWEDGSLKGNAWQHDTFYMMVKALSEIRANGKIKNVVIDLSNNGGGVLAACYNALGFLTDKDIELPMSDLLTKEKDVAKLRVDSDNDKDFTDDDAYSEFNYYILTSGSTFSAANYFTSVCKDMGIAKIIGQRSGGGMCGVGQSSLLDGTIFNISSNNCLNSATKVGENDYEFNEIETGVAVDYELPLDKFYDLPYLNTLINNNFEEVK